MSFSQVVRRKICPNPSLIRSFYAKRIFVNGSSDYLYSRNFSSDKRNEAEVQTNSATQQSKIGMSIIKSYMPVGFAVGGGSVALYGISKIMYFVTTTFMTLTPTASLYYGFIGGSLSAALAAGAGILLLQSSRGIDHERLWRRAISELSKNDKVKRNVGFRIRAGDMKAYLTTQRGGLLVHKGSLSWAKSRCEMIFPIEGYGDHLYTEGFVTVVVSKKFGLYDKIEFLSVTLLDDKSTNIIVKGDESMVSLRDPLNKFIANHNRKLPH